MSLSKRFFIVVEWAFGHLLIIYKLTIHVEKNILIIAFYFIGGNAAIVVSTRVAQENLAFKPKIQVLIYPWVQKFFTKLPSQARYGETGILGEAKFGLSRFASWYLGITNITQDLINVYRENEHLGLFDEKEQKRILSLLDTSKIPDKYKPDKAYYETQSNYQIPSKVPENSLLNRDPKVTELIRKLFEPKFSPLLATKEDLVILPKTYLQILEWDSLKDEALLYAERLKEAGVNTHVDFFENAFHGIASMTHGSYGYQIARDMQDKLIKYLKENL